MAQRLNENAILQAYETGVRGFSLNSSQMNLDFNQTVNLKELLTSKNPKKAVQAIAPPTLYQSIKAVGVEDCVEVLPLISSDQWERIVDYDCWGQNEVAPKKFFRWLKVFKEAGSDQVSKRIQELDEHLQISLLNGIVHVFDQDAYDRMSPSQQDALYRFPNDAMFFSILSEDDEIKDGIQIIVESLMASDMNYIMSLIAHAGYYPPGEAQLQSLQFRNARMEEDGFVPFDDAYQIFSLFRKHQIELLEEKASKLGVDFQSKTAGELQVSGSSKTLLEESLELLAQSEKSADGIRANMIYLANSVAAFAGIEASDFSGRKACFEQTTQMINLGLEILCGNNASAASVILATEYPKQVFQFANSKLKEIREDFLNKLECCGIKSEKSANLLRADKYGRLLRHFDLELSKPLGFENLESFKGFFNRFPLTLVSIDSIEELSQDTKSKLVFQPICTLNDLYSSVVKMNAIFASLLLTKEVPEKALESKSKVLLESFESIEDFEANAKKHLINNLELWYSYSFFKQKETAIQCINVAIEEMKFFGDTQKQNTASAGKPDSKIQREESK